jgi:hypothetical protein
MTIWESLDPEVQRRCLELAEGAIGRPVTWDEVDPAWQQDWLQSVQAELCADRWEDESPGEQRRLLAILEECDECQARDELQSIITELGVDCTPDDPDWEALFYALRCKSEPAARRRRGRPSQPIQKLLEFVRDFVSEREKGSHEGQGPRSDNDVLRLLHQTKRSGRRQLKGKEIPFARKTLEAKLTRARESPALRDILRPDYEKCLLK